MRKLFGIAVVGALLAVVSAPAALATHSWGGYHWARTSNPFTVKLGDNMDGTWDPYLKQTSIDWTQSTVLDTTIVPGGSRNKRCSATSGRDEVCNASYGNNGWLGLASIWLSSGTTHITQGTVKVNDTYFSQAAYNNTSEKEHVVCQEVGHTFGLDHQSTDGSSLNTCMDYYHNTSDSDTKSTTPNQHDYDELGIIYTHLDSSTTIGSTVGRLPDAVPDWAAASQKESKYVDRLPNGDTLITFVIWANPIHSPF